MKFLFVLISLLQIRFILLEENIIKKDNRMILLNNTLVIQKEDIHICGSSICFKETSKCINNKCKCDKYHTSLNNDLVNCIYDYKLRIIAILLEFFFPFGVGHFYSLRYYYGYYKMIFFILPIIIRYLLLNRKFLLGINLFMLCNLLATALVFIEVFDIICFYYGYFKDGYGKKML